MKNIEITQQLDCFDKDGLRDLLYLFTDFLKAMGFGKKTIDKHIKPEVFDEEEE